jgi:hypothetical protein
MRERGRTGLTAVVIGLGALAAEGARAQEVGLVQDAQRLVRGKPLTVQVGGGVSNFTEGGAQDLTAPGALWTVRAVSGMDSALGLEAGYTGAAQPFTPADGQDDGTVVRTEFEGRLRAAAPLRLTDGFVAPYLTAGLGYGLYSLLGADPEGVQDNDHVITIPLGLGVAAGYERFSLDTRLEYRPAYGDEMFADANRTEFAAGLNSFSFGASVGYTF